MTTKPSIKHEIYVASSWRNKYQQDIVALLRANGHIVYDFKHPVPGNEGFHWSEIDVNWKDWTPAGFRKGLQDARAEGGYAFDIDALEGAGVVVLLLPSGRSAHLEAAYHRGMGGPVIVHMPEPCEPELMYKMCNVLTINEGELIAALTFGISKLVGMSI